MAELIIVVFGLGMVFLVPLLVAIAAHRRANRFESSLVVLKDRLDFLNTRLQRIDPTDTRHAAPEPETAPPEPQAQQPTLNQTPPAIRDVPVHVEATQPSAMQSASQQNPKTIAASSSSRTMSGEEAFASKWLVWFGGITISLGGIFLVKYSVDHALISAPVRILLGMILSIMLVASGEWLRHRPIQRAIARVQADFVPPALTGAGVCIAFGTIYAGYALFNLFSPTVAFVGLAIVSSIAMALSLLQGPFVAVLGILCAFVVPMLMKTDTSSAWGLFSYLLIVATGAFFIVRYKDWWWLAWITVACSVGWQLLWLTEIMSPNDIAPVSGFMILVFILSVSTRLQAIFGNSSEISHPLDIAAMTMIEKVVLGTAIALALMTAVLVVQTTHDLGALIMTGIVAVLFCACAYKSRSLESLFPLGAILALALLFTWNTPEITDVADYALFQGEPMGPLASLPVLDEIRKFNIVSAIVIVGFSIFGFVGLWRSKRPDLWAAVSGFSPLVVLTILYWKMAPMMPDIVWSVTVLTLGGIATIAASKVANARNRPHMEATLGLYALTTLTALCLGLTLILETAWLTVAIAMMLPGMAWVHDRFGIGYLRPAATAVAVIVLARLLLLHQIPDMLFRVQLEPGWILYSYGLSALSFTIAARWFRKHADDFLVTVLEAGAIATSVAMINLEIHNFMGSKTLFSGPYTLLEQSLHSISWLASGCGMYIRNQQRPRAVSLWAAKILLGLSAAHVIGFQAMVFNPWSTGEFVGALPIFNMLSLAYLVPVVFAALIYWIAGKQQHNQIRLCSSVIGIGLAFLWLNMEVRNLFHDGFLRIGGMSDAERYSYSVAWLASAAPLLAIGLLWKQQAIRYAGLGLTLLVVAKVFLLDMSGLSGLYRVVSFLGLGFCLVAIGFCYQRFFR